MKKTILAVLLFVFLAVNLSAGGSPGIQNEYWSWDNGTAQNLIFENYFFSDDGTFRFSWGHSGDSYSGGWYDGTYFYDSEKKKIVFNTAGKGTMGTSEKMERPAPKELKILEFMDSGMVRIDIKAAHEQNKHHIFDGVMQRHKGRIKEQRWIFTHYTTAYEFYFDPQGNCFYKEGRQGFDADSQYECEYNLIGNMLFLKVKSVRIMKPNLKKNDDVKYDSAVKTYIRLAKASGGEVRVENANFGGILGGSRNWEYNNGKYIVKNRLPAVKQKDFYVYKIEGGSAGDLLVEDGQVLISGSEAN